MPLRPKLLGIVLALTLQASLARAESEALVGAGLDLGTVVRVDLPTNGRVVLVGQRRGGGEVRVAWSAPGGASTTDFLPDGGGRLELRGEEAGTWSLAFPGHPDQAILDPWTIDAVDVDGKPLPGAVWSERWGFDSGSYVRRSAVSLWIRAERGQVVRADFQGLAAFWWVALASPTGFGPGGSALSSSLLDSRFEARLPIHLQPPRAAPPAVLTGSLDAVKMVDEGLLVTFTLGGPARVTLDCNGLTTFSRDAGTHEVVLPDACETVLFSADSGKIHLALVDVEEAAPGLSLTQLTTEGERPLALSWDDSRLVTTGGALLGELTTTTATRHGWTGNRLGEGPGNNAVVDTAATLERISAALDVDRSPGIDVVLWPDAGPVDAGTPDAGGSGEDAGGDGGTDTLDAGTPDAGSPDAGSVDTELTEPDAGPTSPTDTIDDPDGPPPPTIGFLGTRCSNAGGTAPGLLLLLLGRRLKVRRSVRPA